MEIYTLLKGRQDNKLCSLKKFDFSNRTKKVGRREYNFLKTVFSEHQSNNKFKYGTVVGLFCKVLKSKPNRPVRPR